MDKVNMLMNQKKIVVNEIQVYLIILRQKKITVISLKSFKKLLREQRSKFAIFICIKAPPKKLPILIYLNLNSN